MRNKTIPIIGGDGVKSTLLWDEKTDAWTYLSGSPDRKSSPQEYYKIIPTLFRGVETRSNAVANLPWELKSGDEVVDSSEDYKDVLGLGVDMYVLLYLIEASLVLAGKSLWKREKNPAGFAKLRHLNPDSMELQEDKAIKGELVWKRSSNGVVTELTTKEVIYLWYPDPYVELGPPSAWPAKAALHACGVLVSVDAFAAKFFERGAIKAMLFAMEGAPLSEAQKFENWWQKFISGIQNAYSTKVINTQKVEPVVVGEGIKELENVTLTHDKREEIALALSIPMSILFANAANYATAERDKLNWYEDKIVPEANFIASVLNEQLITPLGYRFSFKPETLDIFQEDEQQRAQAMSYFMDALEKAGSFEMAQALFKIYGVEVDDEAMGLIEAHYKGKEERAAEIAQNMQPKPDATTGSAPEPLQDEEDEPQPVRKVDNQQLQRELSIWQSKCISALKRGEPASSVSFVPILIPPENYERITAGLAGAETAEAVKDIFASAFRDEPENEPVPDAMLLIWEELKRANDLLYASAAASS